MDTANSVFSTSKKDTNKTADLCMYIFFGVMFVLLVYGAITRIKEENTEIRYAEKALPDINVTTTDYDNTYEVLEMSKDDKLYIKYNDTEYSKIDYKDTALYKKEVGIKREYDGNDYKVTYSNSGLSTNTEWTAMYYLRNIYGIPGEAVFGDSSFNPKPYYAGTMMDNAGFQHIIVYQYVGLKNFLKIEIQTSRHYYSYESMRKLIDSVLCDYEVK